MFLSSNSCKQATVNMKVLFISLMGYGHLNASIGIAERIIARGHRALFAIDSSWAGITSSYNSAIEEVIFQNPNANSNEKDNEANLAKMRIYMKRFSLVDEPFESLKIASVELEDEFIRHFVSIDEQIKEVINTVKPDVIVLDTYSTSPAVYKSGIPWILMNSAAPLVCQPHKDLPPNKTGYPTVPPNHELWQAYLDLEYERYAEIWEKFSKELVEQYGLPALAKRQTNHWSPYLNIYAYPEELDYLDIRPLPPKWKRFDHFIREKKSEGLSEDIQAFINQSLAKKNDGEKLIYVSMGSLGCVDSDLMEKLIEMLSHSHNNWFIFSLGGEADKLQSKLRKPRMFGARFLPQMEILPFVDLVISHCGNNSLLESFYFSKPVLAVPLFADQMGNAQRITELGLGKRINAYKCSTKEFIDKVQNLLDDSELKSKIEKIGKRLIESKSTDRVAESIEEVSRMNKI